ncbi:MAG: InlB B-repeat-containing protein [Lachnospira sp.]
MKRELSKRKKRFWALIMACVLMLGNVPFISAYATEYHAGSGTHDISDNILHPNDTVIMDSGVGTTNDVCYYDVDGTTVLLSDSYSADADGKYRLVVKEYSDSEFSSTRQMPDGQFKEWEVTDVYVSSGWMSEIKLKAVPYTKSIITYYNVDGATNSNPAFYYEGKEVVSLTDASKEGYTFGGWYTTSTFDDGSKVTSISATQTDLVTLYAKFTVDDYDIEYVLNGGTNSASNPDKYTYGVGVASLSDAEKTGYTFGGWYTTSTFDDGSKVTSISATQTDLVTLYAKFTVDDYDIEYVLNGGTNSASNPDKYTYGVGVASLSDAEKIGYTFDGWYTTSTFDEGSKVTSISATQTDLVKLYAKFTVDDYDIEYVLNGGTNSASNPDKYTYGVGVASLSDAEKTGYTFGGWYTTSTFDDGSKVTSISATQTDLVKLYAKFTENVTEEIAPETGDNSWNPLWGILMIGAVIVLIGVACSSNRKRAGR